MEITKHGNAGVAGAVSRAVTRSCNYLRMNEMSPEGSYLLSCFFSPDCLMHKASRSSQFPLFYKPSSLLTLIGDRSESRSIASQNLRCPVKF